MGWLAVNECEHGENAAVAVRSGWEVELGEDRADRRFDRLDAQVQMVADRSVGETLGHEGENVVLSFGEPLETCCIRSFDNALGKKEMLEHECSLRTETIKQSSLVTGQGFVSFDNQIPDVATVGVEHRDGGDPA